MYSHSVSKLTDKKLNYGFILQCLFYLDFKVKKTIQGFLIEIVIYIIISTKVYKLDNRML